MVHFIFNAIENRSSQQITIRFRHGAETCLIGKVQLGDVHIAPNERYGPQGPPPPMAAVDELRCKVGFNEICAGLQLPWLGQGFLELETGDAKDGTRSVVRLSVGPRGYHGPMKDFLQVHGWNEKDDDYLDDDQKCRDDMTYLEVAQNDEQLDKPLKEMDLGVRVHLFHPTINGKLYIEKLEKGSNGALSLANAIYIDCSPDQFALAPAQPFEDTSGFKMRYKDERTGTVFDAAIECYIHTLRYPAKNGKYAVIRPEAGVHVYRWDGPGFQLAAHHGIVVGNTEEMTALIAPGAKHLAEERLNMVKTGGSKCGKLKPMHAEAHMKSWDNTWVVHFNGYEEQKTVELCTLSQFARDPVKRRGDDSKEPEQLRGIYLLNQNEDPGSSSKRLARAESIRRAMLFIGKWGYHPESNNSEVLAFRCSSPLVLSSYFGSPQLWAQQGTKNLLFDVGVPVAGFLVGGPIGLAAGLATTATAHAASHNALANDQYAETANENFQHKVFSSPDAEVEEGMVCFLCGETAECRFGCAHVSCARCAFNHVRGMWDLFRGPETKIIPDDPEEAEEPEAFLPCPYPPCWEPITPAFVIRVGAAKSAEDLQANSIAAQLDRAATQLGFGAGSKDVLKRVAATMKPSDGRKLQKGGPKAFGEFLKDLNKKNPPLAQELKTEMVGERLVQCGVKPGTAKELAAALQIEDLQKMQDANPKELLEILKKVQKENPQVVQQVKRDLLAEKLQAWGIRENTANDLADQIQIDDLKELESKGPMAFPEVLDKMQKKNPKVSENVKIDLIRDKGLKLGLTEDTAERLGKSLTLEELGTLQVAGPAGLVKICQRLKVEEPNLLVKIKHDMVVGKATAVGVKEETAAELAKCISLDDLEAMGGDNPAQAFSCIAKKLRKEKPVLIGNVKDELMIAQAMNFGVQEDAAKRLAARVSLDDVDAIEKEGLDGLAAIARRLCKEDMPLALEVTQNMIEDKTKAIGIQPHIAKELAHAVREEHLAIALEPGGDIAVLAAEMMEDQPELMSVVCRDLVRAKAEDLDIRSDLAVRLSEAIPEDRLQNLLKDFSLDELMAIIGGLAEGPNKTLSAEIARDLVAKKTKALGLRADLAERLSEAIDEHDVTKLLRDPSVDALMASLTNIAERNPQLALDITRNIVENTMKTLGASQKMAQKVSGEVIMDDVQGIIKNGIMMGLSQAADRMSEEHPDMVHELKRMVVKSRALALGQTPEAAEAMADFICGPPDLMAQQHAKQAAEERRQREMQEEREKEARALGLRPGFWAYIPDL